MSNDRYQLQPIMQGMSYDNFLLAVKRNFSVLLNAYITGANAVMFTGAPGVGGSAGKRGASLLYVEDDDFLAAIERDDVQLPTGITVSNFLSTKANTSLALQAVLNAGDAAIATLMHSNAVVSNSQDFIQYDTLVFSNGAALYLTFTDNAGIYEAFLAHNAGFGNTITESGDVIDIDAIYVEVLRRLSLEYSSIRTEKSYIVDFVNDLYSQASEALLPEYNGTKPTGYAETGRLLYLAMQVTDEMTDVEGCTLVAGTNEQLKNVYDELKKLLSEADQTPQAKQARKTMPTGYQQPSLLTIQKATGRTYGNDASTITGSKDNDILPEKKFGLTIVDIDSLHYDESGAAIANGASFGSFATITKSLAGLWIMSNSDVESMYGKVYLSKKRYQLFIEGLHRTKVGSEKHEVDGASNVTIGGKQVHIVQGDSSSIVGTAELKRTRAITTYGDTAFVTTGNLTSTVNSNATYDYKGTYTAKYSNSYRIDLLASLNTVNIGTADGQSLGLIYCSYNAPAGTGASGQLYKYTHTLNIQGDLNYSHADYYELAESDSKIIRTTQAILTEQYNKQSHRTYNDNLSENFVDCTVTRNYTNNDDIAAGALNETVNGATVLTYNGTYNCTVNEAANYTYDELHVTAIQRLTLAIADLAVICTGAYTCQTTGDYTVVSKANVTISGDTSVKIKSKRSYAATVSNDYAIEAGGQYSITSASAIVTAKTVLSLLSEGTYVVNISGNTTKTFTGALNETVHGTALLNYKGAVTYAYENTTQIVCAGKTEHYYTYYDKSSPVGLSERFDGQVSRTYNRHTDDIYYEGKCDKFYSADAELPPSVSMYKFEAEVYTSYTYKGDKNFTTYGDKTKPTALAIKAYASIAFQQLSADNTVSYEYAGPTTYAYSNTCTVTYLDAVTAEHAEKLTETYADTGRAYNGKVNEEYYAMHTVQHYSNTSVSYGSDTINGAATTTMISSVNDYAHTHIFNPAASTPDRNVFVNRMYNAGSATAPTWQCYGPKVDADFTFAHMNINGVARLTFSSDQRYSTLLLGCNTSNTVIGLQPSAIYGNLNGTNKGYLSIPAGYKAADITDSQTNALPINTGDSLLQAISKLDARSTNIGRYGKISNDWDYADYLDERKKNYDNWVAGMTIDAAFGEVTDVIADLGVIEKEHMYIDQTININSQSYKAFEIDMGAGRYNINDEPAKRQPWIQLAGRPSHSSMTMLSQLMPGRLLTRTDVGVTGIYDATGMTISSVNGRAIATLNQSGLTVTDSGGTNEMAKFTGYGDHRLNGTLTVNRIIGGTIAGVSKMINVALAGHILNSARLTDYSQFPADVSMLYSFSDANANINCTSGETFGRVMYIMNFGRFSIRVNKANTGSSEAYGTCIIYGKNKVDYVDIAEFGACFMFIYVGVVTWTDTSGKILDKRDCWQALKLV